MKMPIREGRFVFGYRNTLIYKILSSSLDILSRNLSLIWLIQIARALEVGTVWVNDWFVRDLRVPFGGAKQSGIGREGGHYGYEFYYETKNVRLANR